MMERRAISILSLVVGLAFSSSAFGQAGSVSNPGASKSAASDSAASNSGGSGGRWLWLDQSLKEKPPAPTPAKRHDLTGMWYAFNAVQAGGVQEVPNDGKPEHQLPYTPYGLNVYKSHKPLEGYDAVPDTEQNDPRELCDPLGFPRANHYQLRQTQIFQDSVKVLIAYQYENKWRIIWTDGRPLPKLVDSGVKIGNDLREQRYYGYSVGKWTDDTTLVVQTIGTFPEDRVWLDATGRPISDQIQVTETYHRVDSNTLELSETINDPKMYTRPWVTINKLRMRLLDPHTDVMEFYCSPTEQMRYDKLTSAPTAEQPGK